ncbi:hypothetical protein [Romboutsia sp.]|uniref:hypothetical protein n=1 Tax=Romboutsia sp. TaxID=1965302 RepID=UPI002CDC2BFB|nr:hypothetical protein [Romboutsia sp.]HSQ89280.1 hypothetical protein [Romboutsia sp.]
MTRTYKFNDRSFNQNAFTRLISNKNIKITLAILALIVLVATYDLNIMETVSESAIFM